ncbi:MAG: 50S ribosomal protein L31e, partial [Nanoarchaeota archaeon]
MINMAKVQETKSKVILERTYNVPLRRDFVKAPKYKRSNRALSALKHFLIKHMKSENVKIGKHLNQKIWENGIQNPPHHVKINAIKDDKGLVRAEIFGKEIELEKKEKTKESVAERIGLKQKEKEDLTQTYKPVTDSKKKDDETSNKEAEEKVDTEEKELKKETLKNEKEEIADIKEKNLKKETTSKNKTEEKLDAKDKDLKKETT